MNPDGYHRSCGAGFTLFYKTLQGFLEKREIYDIFYFRDDINIRFAFANIKRPAADAAVEDGSTGFYQTCFHAEAFAVRSE